MMASKRERIIETLKLLKGLYPEAHCALYFKNPFELLVATMLSAQTTDERVNQVTPHLFSKFPDPDSLSQAKTNQVERLINSVNFYKTKAKHLVRTSQLLVLRHKGQVPTEVAELVAFPGVGKKTANVVLGNAFNISSGVVVDTHVGRLARRMGWSAHKDPIKVEEDLKKLIPKSDWILVSHLLIWHGRQVCMARNPNCQNCALIDLCLRKDVK